MKKVNKKVRKGMTVIEIVVAMLLMALAIIVMGRLTATRIAETESLNYQFTMQAVDGMMYSIYSDFHACRDYTVESSPTFTKTILSFDLGSGGIHIYEYDKDTYWFYFNGAQQFKIEDFSAVGDMQHLYVSMKLPNGERLEYTTYA